MEFNIEEAQELFVKESLSEHGDYIMELLVEQIVDKKLIKSTDLLSQLKYNITKKNNDFSLNVSFPGYGRAVEIGYYKRKKNYNQETNEFIKKLFGIESVEDVRRKKAKRDVRKLNWYSRSVYGSLNKLISKLMYGFGEEELKYLKRIIEQESYKKTESGYIGPVTSGV